MKKIINGLVLGMVSLGLLCGCSSKSDEYAEKFIELYCNNEYQYVDENKTITATIKKIDKEDNEESDYEIISDKNGNIYMNNLKYGDIEYLYNGHSYEYDEETNTVNEIYGDFDVVHEPQRLIKYFAQELDYIDDEDSDMKITKTNTGYNVEFSYRVSGTDVDGMLNFDENYNIVSGSTETGYKKYLFDPLTCNDDSLEIPEAVAALGN